MKKFAILLTLTAILLLAGVALAADSYEIPWYVIGGGGEPVVSNDGVYALNGTIGQPVVEVIGEGSYEVCSGFWCGFVDLVSELFFFLPLVLR